MHFTDTILTLRCILSHLWGTSLNTGPTEWDPGPWLLWGDECCAARGVSCSAYVRADEWGGEADKMGHTDVAFLGNAVKCRSSATCAYNWSRAALSLLDSVFWHYWKVMHFISAFHFAFATHVCSAFLFPFVSIASPGIATIVPVGFPLPLIWKPQGLSYYFCGSHFLNLIWLNVLRKSLMRVRWWREGVFFLGTDQKTRSWGR